MITGLGPAFDAAKCGLPAPDQGRAVDIDVYNLGNGPHSSGTPRRVQVNQNGCPARTPSAPSAIRVGDLTTEELAAQSPPGQMEIA